jgi:acetolactate synthase-1/2/3 large subunit
MIEMMNDAPIAPVKPYGHVLTGVRPPGPKEGYRIAAYQLVDYLELLGVEVVFGLCGHTVMPMRQTVMLAPRANPAFC